MSSPTDHAEDYQDFLNWVANKRVNGTRATGDPAKHSFIPSDRLDVYLNEANRLSRLLKAVFPGDTQPPVAPSAIRGKESSSKYCKVFAILLLIGKGRFIPNFTQIPQLSDSYLPFGVRPSDFPRYVGKDQDFFTEFFENQWIFCAYEMHFNHILKLEEERILPFICEERLGKGGSAEVHKIVLHDTYDRLRPPEEKRERNVSKTAAATTKSSTAHVYVLKTYHQTRHARTYYQNEVGAFKKLTRNGRPHPYIIAFYGCYEQANTLNLVLEYADMGTLEQYFQTFPSPIMPEDINAFWCGLSKIAEALRSIHDVAPDENASTLQVLRGWHLDVKPANILICRRANGSHYNVTFKLADLGTSHFKHFTSGVEAADQFRVGTTDYGSPECYRQELSDRSKLTVKQSFDVWSLGCVFSESATWLVLGCDNLYSYRTDRRNETSIIPNFRHSGCFHDGIKVLDTVVNIHYRISQTLRASDFATKFVLDIVKDMLAKEDIRPLAVELCARLERMVQDADTQLRNFSPGLSPPPIDHRYTDGFIHSPEQTLLTPKPPPDIQPTVPQISRILNGNHYGGGLEAPHPDSTSHFHPSYRDYGPRNHDYHAESNRPRPAEDAEHRSSVPRNAQPPVGQFLPGGPMGEVSPIESNLRYTFSNHQPVAPVWGARRLAPATLDSYPPHNRSLSGPSHPRSHSTTIPLDSFENTTQPSNIRFTHPSLTNIHGPHDNRHPNRASRKSRTAQDPGFQQSILTQNEQGQTSQGQYNENFEPLSPTHYRSPTRNVHGHRHIFDAPHSIPHGDTSKAVHSLQPDFVSNNALPRADVPRTRINGDRRPLSVSGSMLTAPITLGPKSGPGIHSPVSPLGHNRQWNSHNRKRKLSVATALAWYNRRKNDNGSERREPLQYEKLIQNELKDRDLVFWIDDNETMAPHWQEVQQLFAVLAYTVKKADRDGMELIFTTPGREIRNKSSQPLARELMKHEPNGTYDFENRLSSVLSKYAHKLTQWDSRRGIMSRFISSSPPPPLNLYIFTNGIWHMTKAANPIKMLVEKLIKLNLPHHQVGIQFIRFGNHPVGISQLEFLDSKMGLTWDIVDTEPSDGDILKMLLGPTRKDFDDDDDDDSNDNDVASNQPLELEAGNGYLRSPSNGYI